MRPEISERMKSMYSRICVLVKELAVIAKREAAERQNVTNYQERIKKLDDLAEESLSGGDNDYAKYKVSIRKLAELLGCSEEILAKVQQVKRPLQNELQTHRHNLMLLLGDWAWEYCRAVDAEKRHLIDAVMNAVEECLQDIEKTCQEFGVGFVPAKHLILFGLPEDFVIDYRRTKSQQAAAHKPVIESTHTPEAPVPVPVVQAPLIEPEGTLIPPEPVSQAVAAPGAVPVEEAEPPESIEPERPGPEAEHIPHEPVEPIAEPVREPAMQMQNGQIT